VPRLYFPFSVFINVTSLKPCHWPNPEKEKEKRLRRIIGIDFIGFDSWMSVILFRFSISLKNTSKPEFSYVTKHICVKAIFASNSTDRSRNSSVYLKMRMSYFKLGDQVVLDLSDRYAKVPDGIKKRFGKVWISFSYHFSFSQVLSRFSLQIHIPSIMNLGSLTRAT